MMAETGSGGHDGYSSQPPKHNPDPPPQGSGVQVDINHFKTPAGILKLIQLGIGIICMICASPARTSSTNFFLFAVVISFIMTLIWIFVYLLTLKAALNVPINWLLTELLNTLICTILYFIGFIVQLTAWSPYTYVPFYSANIAGGVFGLFNTMAYAAGTFLLFKDYKSSTSPQPTATTTTSVP